jgi:membrane protein YdbS with pleckstrin-like domain
VIEGPAQRDRPTVWETFPSWAQFSWLYLLSAVFALRGALFFRFGVDGWEMWMIGTGILLVCAVILRRWAHYELHRERIIVRNGYTGREIHSVPLTDVRAVTVQQGLIADFFGIGTITISSSSTNRSVSLRGVRDPEEVKISILATAWRQSQTPETRFSQGEGSRLP